MSRIRSTHYHSVHSDDLVKIEKILSEWVREKIVDKDIDPRRKKQIRDVQEVLTNIRFDYFPPIGIEEIGGMDDGY